MTERFQSLYRPSLLASAMLVLAIVQGTSFTLTLAVRSAFASDLAITAVTLLWLLMYVVATTGLIVSSGLNWVTWMVRYRLALTLLLTGAIFSTAWSIDPALTIERVVHLVGTSLIAIYIGFKLPLTHLLKTTAVTLGLIMLASAAAATWLPALGQQDYEGVQVWAGVMASKNTLGFWASISVLMLFSLTFWHASARTRALYVALGLVSALCLYKSVSATSFLSLISAAAVMAYVHLAFSLRMGLIATVITGVMVSIMIGMAFYHIDTAELIGRSGDLTGRAEVWAQTWQLIMDKPLSGFGYGTIWYPTEASVWIQQSLTDFTWVVFHAHNGLLQIASELGLPLTLLMVVLLVQQMVEILYCHFRRQQPGNVLVLGFMVALLVSNYSEARLLIHRELYWILFIALPISMLHQTVALPGRYLSTVTPHWRDFQVSRLRTARERLSHRRGLKKRLRKQRPITIINDSRPSQVAAEPPTLYRKPPLSNPPANIRQNIHTASEPSKDSQDAIQRKLARRKSKVG